MKEAILQYYREGGTVAEGLVQWPDISQRTHYNYRNEALQKESAADNARNDVAAATPQSEVLPGKKVFRARSRAVESKSETFAKRAAMASVFVLLLASIFTIAEVLSQVYALVKISGYLIAVAVIVTPVTILFTHGNRFLRVAIVFIAFIIESFCNVVIIRADIGTATLFATQDEFAKTAGAMVAGIGLPLFSLFIILYLQKLQGGKKQSV